MITLADVPFELEVCQHPESEEPWLAYVQHLKSREAADMDAWLVYERALLIHQKSYLLWRPYLQDRTDVMLSVTRSWGTVDEHVHQIALTNGCYERCLLLRLTDDCKIWVDYAMFLLAQRRVRRALSVLDDALRVLPWTQHQRIWQLIMRVVEHLPCPKTGLHLLKRFCQLEKTTRTHSNLLDAAIKAGSFADAVDTVVILLELSPKSIEDPALLERMCNLVNECPPQERCEKFEKWILDRINRPKYQGTMFTALATYWVHLGELEEAEGVFEQALPAVVGGKNFSIVYEAYGRLEETLIKELISAMSEGEDDFVHLSMQKFESLIQKRPQLVIDAMLRQNANKPHLWLRKVNLVDAEQRSSLFEEALSKCSYKTQLYLAFAKHLQSSDSDWKGLLQTRAADQCHQDPQFWIEWSRLYGESVVDSLAVLQQGTKRCRDRTLWTFHVDFLESLYYRKGRQFADDTKLVYQRMLDLGLITKQQVLNFVNLVEQLGGSFHDVFQILSKACNKIPWPARGELWIILLDKAIAFWVPEGRIERIREVYEDATKDTPPDCVMAIYKHWAAFEEQHGAPSKVVGKLCSAIRKLDNLDRQLEMVDFAVSKAKRLSGLTGARPVFELALKDLALTDEALMSLSLEFAGLEAALGDILRARAIFTHCAQSCRVYPGDSSPLWAHWADFEQRYGDEQTMRDMLRLKRQLQKRAQQDPFFVKASQS